jgi:hypothetical protein
MRLAAAFSIVAASALAAGAAAAQAPAAPGFDRPVAAGSWGGVVRNGPGMEHDRVAVLREGEPVTLLYNTRIMRDGYPWFLIRLRDGRLGFQWGGILCRTGTAVEGVFERCTR